MTDDYMNKQLTAEPEELLAGVDAVIVDCRFSLAGTEEGCRDYQHGHIPGAWYLDLNLDMSAPVVAHGGRHPLPAAQDFAETLARCGIGPNTAVVAYDDSRFAFASRLWWMMRSLGYQPPRLLNGGYAAWLAAGGEPDTVVPSAQSLVPGAGVKWRGLCDIEGLKELQAAGATLVDSREQRRYEGLEEPIDSVAGHIPGAVNHPWQRVTNDASRAQVLAEQGKHWGDTAKAEQIVVYCGSGVTACVNLFSLALLGRDDAVLYGGSWSDWCSYL
jgi:thiosulfate/3-mercaptopyruvate sulfurtransferase